MKLLKRTLNAPVTSDEASSLGDALPPGRVGPDFSLDGSTDHRVSLSDYRGQPVILAFYPADWSPVCGDQMVLYNQVLPLFQEHHAQILGISVDGKWSHRAYAEAKNLQFPLLSDFEPKGVVARAYGVYDAKSGTSQRALFVLDQVGVVRWSFVSPNNVNPGANGILTALEALEK